MFGRRKTIRNQHFSIKTHTNFISRHQHPEPARKQKPDFACVFPGRLRCDPIRNLTRCNHVEKSRQDAQVDTVVLKGKFQMISRPVSVPIRRGVDGFDPPAQSGRTQCAGRADRRRMPVRQDVQLVSFNQECVPCRPIMCGFQSHEPSKNCYDSQKMIILQALPGITV